MEDRIRNLEIELKNTEVGTTRYYELKSIIEFLTERLKVTC